MANTLLINIILFFNATSFSNEKKDVFKLLTEKEGLDAIGFLYKYGSKNTGIFTIENIEYYNLIKDDWRGRLKIMYADEPAAFQRELKNPKNHHFIFFNDNDYYYIYIVADIVIRKRHFMYENSVVAYIVRKETKKITNVITWEQ